MKTKRYIIPVCHHVVFGCEVEVEAKSLKEARKLALKENAQVSGDGYDWDRMAWQKAELGNWEVEQP